ncbi:hypothetical protein D9M68_345340 [compost metagenome]
MGEDLCQAGGDGGVGWEAGEPAKAEEATFDAIPGDQQESGQSEPEGEVEPAVAMFHDGPRVN